MNKYYEVKTEFGLYELRQNRFRGREDKRDVEALKATYDMYLTGVVEEGK